MSTAERFYWLMRSLAIAEFDFPGVIKEIEILTGLHGMRYSPGELESASLTLALPAAFLLLLSLLANIFLPVALLLLTASVALLFVPKILLNFERVSFLSDFLNFTVMFLMTTKFKSQYHAFISAAERAQSVIIKRALSALQLGSASTVKEALHIIKKESEIFGYHIPAIVGMIVAEIEKPDPDYSHALKEVISAYRKMGADDTQRFSRAMNIALALIGLSPAVLLLLVPFSLSFFGVNPTVGFITGSVLMLSLVVVAAVVLSASLPSAVVTEQQVDETLAETLLGVRRTFPREILSGRQVFVIIAVTTVLSLFNPVFFAAVGLALVFYALPSLDTEKMFSASLLLMHELYEVLLRASGRLLRDSGFEQAFSMHARAARLLRAGVAQRLIPFGEVEAISTMIAEMRHYGRELGKAISEVSGLFNELISVRISLLSQLRGFRATTIMLFFMLPFVSVLAVYMVKILSGGGVIEKTGEIPELGTKILALGRANLRVVGTATGTASLFSSLFIATLASYATGVYYRGKYRYYLLYAGMALVLYGIVMFFLVG